MTRGNDAAHPVIETQHVQRWGGDSEGYPDTYSTGGLTKREMFAAMAMQGIMSSDTRQLTREVEKRGELVENAVAMVAVGFADALIAELNKETK